MAMAVAQSQRWNSFIKQVMDQVKRDMESDPKLKKDWEKVQKSTSKIQDRSAVHQERLDEFGNTLKDASAKTSEAFSSFRERAKAAKESFSEKASKATEEATQKSEALKQAADFMKQKAEAGSSVSRGAFTKTKEKFSDVLDKTSQTLNWVGGDHEKNQKLSQWKAAQAHRDAAAAAAEAAEEAAAKAKADAAEAAATDKATADASGGEGSTKAQEDASATQPPMEDALVVSKEKTSSWDRFGANLRDMPFLSNMFENPLFDRLFGESEIAASIREMKDLEPTFFLEDFAEEIEFAVAPHIVQSYLDGDQETLELHCGEAAFAAVNASIKARKTQQMSLDTSLLCPPREIELKGAQRMDKGPPCFIWTFNTQQVNCLRDKSGEIIEGAVDDIRTVYYAMAVTRHPDLEKTLEYPWQVSELAIIGNQPCW
jgi:import inner membrane translocase subunit TIM44